MRRRVRVVDFLFCGLAVAGIGGFAGPAHGFTYLLEESIEANGKGCLSGVDEVGQNLGQLAYDLQHASNWTGNYWGHNDVWPQDFMDTCQIPDATGGSGDSPTDSGDLVVELNHGNTGEFTVAYPRAGVCTVKLKDHVRLGSKNGGAHASTAIYVSCCTLNANHITDTANWSWTRQNIGFHDVTSINADMFGSFWGGISSIPGNVWFGGNTKQSWLNNMEDRPNWFTGDNSPIVISYGTSLADAQNTANNANLKAGVLVSPRGGGPACGDTYQPYFYFWYDMIDHGNGGCK